MARPNPYLRSSTHLLRGRCVPVLFALHLAAPLACIPGDFGQTTDDPTGTIGSITDSATGNTNPADSTTSDDGPTDTADSVDTGSTGGTEDTGQEELPCPANPCEHQGTCALVDEVEVCTCTRNYWGETCQYPRYAHTIDMGGDFAVALTADGGLWRWNFNLTTDLPYEVDPMPGLVAVAAGSSNVEPNVLVLGDGGDVWDWYDRLDIPVGSLPSAVFISSLSDNSDLNLVLGEDDTVWEVSFIAPPVQTNAPANLVAVAAGSTHLALDDDGTAWRWVNDLWEPVPSLPEIVAIATGTDISSEDHHLVVDAAGDVWAWGRNDVGQLGLGNVSDEVTEPVRIESLSNVVSVAAGEEHSFALREDGTVWAWGSGGNGQLGDGISQSGHARWEPAQVLNLTTAVTIVASTNAGIALLEDGTVWQWGYSGSTANQPTPLQIAIPPVAP